MYKKPCTCPSYEGLSYEEIITVSGLREEKSKSKNCCEIAGYICPTLDKALRDATKKHSSKKDKERVRKPKKVLKKKRLVV